MVLRVDEAVGRSSHRTPLAWIPRRNSDGLEDVELTYDTGLHLWRGDLRYKLDSDNSYSVWLEEREGILLDASPTAQPTDEPIVGRRVTYADRIPSVLDI